MTLQSGIRVELRDYAEWVTFGDIFVHGQYDRAILPALGSVSGRRPFVLDLGANTGLFVARAKELAIRHQLPDPEFMLLEASAQLHARLSDLVRQPPLAGNSVAVRGLVGRRQGTVHFSERRFHVMNRIAEKGPTMEYLDLESVVAAGREIDLLKCDIEGAELDFLCSYPRILAQTRRAVFEFHPDLCDIESCRRTMTQYGFSVSWTDAKAGGAPIEFFERT
jgi:FkbM family methyltransferase